MDHFLQCVCVCVCVCVCWTPLCRKLHVHVYTIHLCYVQGAAVGLHLKSSNSRQDLTVLYFHWSESKKRVLATVADLSSHTVRQIHVSTQRYSNSAQLIVHVCNVYLCVPHLNFNNMLLPYPHRQSSSLYSKTLVEEGILAL